MPWLNALVVCPVPRGCLFASPVPGYLSPGNDPEELEAKAVALFKPYRAALLPLFRRYVGLSVSASSGARGASFEQLKHARVNLAQASWLRMCRDFRLVSSLLSSTDATAVFHRCNLRRDKGVVRALLGYAEFLAALRVIALHGFPQADGADGAQHGAGAGAADATVAAVPPAVAREDGEGNGPERGPETASPPVAGPVFSLPPGTKPAVESTPGNLEAADTAKEAASVKALCKYVSIPAGWLRWPYSPGCCDHSDTCTVCRRKRTLATSCAYTAAPRCGRKAPARSVPVLSVLMLCRPA